MTTWFNDCGGSLTNNLAAFLRAWSIKTTLLEGGDEDGFFFKFRLPLAFEPLLSVELDSFVRFKFVTVNQPATYDDGRPPNAFVAVHHQTLASRDCQLQRFHNAQNVREDVAGEDCLLGHSKMRKVDALLEQLFWKVAEAGSFVQTVSAAGILPRLLQAYHGLN